MVFIFLRGTLYWESPSSVLRREPCSLVEDSVVMVIYRLISCIYCYLISNWEEIRMAAVCQECATKRKTSAFLQYPTTNGRLWNYFCVFVSILEYFKILRAFCNSNLIRNNLARRRIFFGLAYFTRKLWGLIPIIICGLGTLGL